jgi:hypothetical protein
VAPAEFDSLKIKYSDSRILLTDILPQDFEIANYYTLSYIRYKKWRVRKHAKRKQA